MINKIIRYIRKHGGFIPSVKYFAGMVQKYGIVSVTLSTLGIEHGMEGEYQRWIKQQEPSFTEAEVVSILEALSIQPLVSFIIPVYNVGEIYLRACLDSIIAQYYTNWEICIADDCSTMPHVKVVLDEYATIYENIKIVYREENGHISAASNSALALATGEYIVHMDNDDFIEPQALLEIIRVINKYPAADLIYTDEDKVNEAGDERREPFFKPDWSPDAILCHMYVTHLGVYRRSILIEIGGFINKYNGSQDYEMLLRFSEKTSEIYHVPEIMYHWRMLPTSAASGENVKDYAFEAGVQGKRDALLRRGIDASVEIIPHIGATNVVYTIPENEPLVTIIIYNRSSTNTYEQAIASVLNKSIYKNIEFIIISQNNVMETSNVTSQKIQAGENESEAYNKASAAANGTVLLFLDESIILQDKNAIKRMLGQALQKHTGLVGAKVVYKDDSVCSAGINILNEQPVFTFQHWSQDNPGYHGRLILNYNYIAISKICLMVSKAKLLSVGGFNSEEFPNNYNDVDLGMRMYANGYFHVSRGDARMETNHNPKGHNPTLQKNASLDDIEKLKQKWPEYMENDPFYNRNLRADFGLK